MVVSFLSLHGLKNPSASTNCRMPSSQGYEATLIGNFIYSADVNKFGHVSLHSISQIFEFNHLKAASGRSVRSTDFATL